VDSSFRPSYSTTGLWFIRRSIQTLNYSWLKRHKKHLIYTKQCPRKQFEKSFVKTFVLKNITFLTAWHSCAPWPNTNDKWLSMWVTQCAYALIRAVYTHAIFAAILGGVFLLMDGNEWMSYECSDEGSDAQNIHNLSTSLGASGEENCYRNRCKNCKMLTKPCPQRSSSFPVRLGKSPYLFHIFCCICCSFRYICITVRLQ
jgi:hypothetical protein